MTPTPTTYAPPTGDTERHLDTAQLMARYRSLAAAPTDRGRVTQLVARSWEGPRSCPQTVRLAPQEPLPGDRWRPTDKFGPDGQLTMMQVDVANMIANGQALSLFGDNLLVDLDLSARNLPPGSRLQVGDCILIATPAPHNGCKKFRERFGLPALQFISDKAHKLARLRGIYVRVERAGTLSVGSPIEVLERPSPAP